MCVGRVGTRAASGRGGNLSKKVHKLSPASVLQQSVAKDALIIQPSTEDSFSGYFRKPERLSIFCHTDVRIILVRRMSLLLVLHRHPTAYTRVLAFHPQRKVTEVREEQNLLH